MINYISGVMNINAIIEPVFMHDPIRFLAMWSSPSVENQSLPHSNPPQIAMNDLIAARGFPETGSSRPIRSCTRRVFLVLVAKKVPIVLRGRPNPAHLCTSYTSNTRSD